MESSPNSKLLLAQKALALQDVFLRSSYCASDDRYFPYNSENPNIEVETRIQTSAHRVLEQNICDGESQPPVRCIEFKVVAGARFLRTEGEPKNADMLKSKCGEVVAVFAAVYQINGKVEEETLMEFGIRNATFHIWPYWREFLHSTAGRLKLPQAILPMFRHQIQNEAKETEADAHEEKVIANEKPRIIDLSDRYELIQLATLFWVSEDELRTLAASVNYDRDALHSILNERFKTRSNQEKIALGFTSH